MIENRMLVGAESYDSQCREVAQGVCSYCKEKVPVCELTEFANGERVCKECMTPYLELNGADMVESYIKEKEWDFLSEYFFKNLDRQEQVEIMRMGFIMMLLDPTQHDFLQQLKVDFCKEDDGFLEFVKEELL